MPRIDRINHSWPGIITLYATSIPLTAFMIYCAKENLRRDHSGLMIFLSAFTIIVGISGIITATMRARKLKRSGKA